MASRLPISPNDLSERKRRYRSASPCLGVVGLKESLRVARGGASVVAASQQNVPRTRAESGRAYSPNEVPT